MSAEVVKHVQTQFQPRRGSDVHTGSKPVHVSFSSMSYPTSVAPRFTFPVVSLDVGPCGFLGFPWTRFQTSCAACSWNDKLSIRVVSNSESLQLRCGTTDSSMLQSERVEQLSVRVVLYKHGEAVAICVTMSSPVCVSCGSYEPLTFSPRPFLDYPRTVLVSLLAMW